MTRARGRAIGSSFFLFYPSLPEAGNLACVENAQTKFEAYACVCVHIYVCTSNFICVFICIIYIFMLQNI